MRGLAANTLTASLSFLIYVLAFVGLLALVAVALAVLFSDDTELERARIEMEVRQAERRIHNIARETFRAMLEEARTPDPVRRA
ncbi:MAG: hypothetical protein ACRDNP_09200 [Gaiellaceae bacterium]